MKSVLSTVAAGALVLLIAGIGYWSQGTWQGGMASIAVNALDESLQGVVDTIETDTWETLKPKLDLLTTQAMASKYPAVWQYAMQIMAKLEDYDSAFQLSDQLYQHLVNDLKSTLKDQQTIGLMRAQFQALSQQGRLDEMSVNCLVVNNQPESHGLLAMHFYQSGEMAQAVHYWDELGVDANKPPSHRGEAIIQSLYLQAKQTLSHSS